MGERAVLGKAVVPYETSRGGYERANRLGHAPAVFQAIAEQREYFIPAASIEATGWLDQFKVAAIDLGLGAPPRYVIAIDGSRQEVEARAEFPSVLYAFFQVAAVLVDLDKLDAQAALPFVDPAQIRKSRSTSILGGDLPSSGAYIMPGKDARESWRLAIFELFASRRLAVFDRDETTMLDLLFWIHGDPKQPATAVVVPSCPNSSIDCEASNIAVGTSPVACPSCGTTVYPTDVLRIWEEVVEYGSNETALGRLSQVAELFVTLGLLSQLFWYSAPLLADIAIVVDGPLAMFGPPAKLKTHALSYVQAIGRYQAAAGLSGPFICGIEKSGSFANYARALARTDVVLPGTLLRVDAPIIAKVLNKDTGIGHAKDDYWGRRFFYRTTDKRILVFSVPPGSGLPYDKKEGQPDPAAYPGLATAISILDKTGTRMYDNAVIPIAFAHEAAAYPIGVGSEVLRLVAKEKLGLSTQHPRVPAATTNSAPTDGAHLGGA